MENTCANGSAPFSVKGFILPSLLLLVLSACGGGGDAGSEANLAYDGPLATPGPPSRARPPLPGSYNATIIPVPSESITVGRKSINAAGQVTGTYRTYDGKNRGFFYDGRLIDIGTLGGLETRPTAINNAGQVVGASDTTYRIPHIPSIYNTEFNYQKEAFIWSRERGMRAIAPVPDDRFRSYPDSSSNATDINNSGQVIGRKRTIMGNYHPPFIWTEKDGLRDAENVLEEWDHVSGLNDAGHFVGNGIPLQRDPSFPDRLSTKNIFYSTLTNEAIPLFDPNNEPNPEDTIVDFLAGDLNEAGTVAGSRSEFNRQTSTRTKLAIVVRPLQNYTEERIGETIGVNVESHAVDINSSEEVVVVTGRSDSESRKGYFWSKARGLVDIGAFDGIHIEPVAINDDGIVVGRSKLPNGSFAAFAWSERTGLVRLDSRIRNMNPRPQLREAIGITDSGIVLAKTDKDLVLLRPISPRPSPPGRR